MEKLFILFPKSATFNETSKTVPNQEGLQNNYLGPNALVDNSIFFTKTQQRLIFVCKDYVLKYNL